MNCCKKENFNEKYDKYIDNKDTNNKTKLKPLGDVDELIFPDEDDYYISER